MKWRGGAISRSSRSKLPSSFGRKRIRNRQQQIIWENREAAVTIDKRIQRLSTRVSATSNFICYPRNVCLASYLPLIALLIPVAAFAITGQAPPAQGYAARAIVMVVDPRGDLCTGTALARDLVLTAAHCVTPDMRIKIFQTGQTIAVRGVARHPRFDRAAYAASRATADVALIKLCGAALRAGAAGEARAGAPRRRRRRH